MKAAGAYLRALREAAGWTQHDVAARTGVSARTYMRYESGEISIPSDTLALIVDVLGAAPAHIQYLFRRKDELVEQDGIDLAKQYLSSQDQAIVDRFIASVHDDELDEIIAVARQLRGKNRNLLAKWLGFGRGLTEK